MKEGSGGQLDLTTPIKAFTDTVMKKAIQNNIWKTGTLSMRSQMLTQTLVNPEWSSVSQCLIKMVFKLSPFHKIKLNSYCDPFLYLRNENCCRLQEKEGVKRIFAS